MTTEQLDELKAQIARLHEFAEYYAPAYMQRAAELEAQS